MPAGLEFNLMCSMNPFSSSGEPGADELEFPLDRSSGVPLYRQLALRLRQGILSGVLCGGARLPNDMVLAQRYRVSRLTVGRAILQLDDEGLLVRHWGRGTEVVHRHVDRPLALNSLLDDLAAGESVPHTTVLTNEVITPPASIATRLDIRPVEPVLHLRRISTVGTEPLAILDNYLPRSRVNLEPADLSESGLYRAMRNAGVQMRVADQRISARPGSADECRLLCEPVHSPMMTMQRLTHDSSGSPVEWGEHVYRASRYEFTITLQAR